MHKFIAHVVLRPNEGGPAYTVETEFKAGSYPQAWEHISRMGARFNATVQSHRIQQLAGGASDDGEAMLFLPAPTEVAAAISAAVSNPKVPPEALTVNVEKAEWFGTTTVQMPEVKPFPIEEDDEDDTAAA